MPGSVTPERVLVIDASSSSRAVLLQHLEQWEMSPVVYPSLDVAAASSGPQAFDLAILDNDTLDAPLDSVTRVTGDASLVLLCSGPVRAHVRAIVERAHEPVVDRDRALCTKQRISMLEYL